MSAYLVYIMGLFYLIAGINHFINPVFYIKMIKDFLPFPKEIIYLSGFIEIVLGIAVCFSATRKFAAFGIVALLIAVFPANIYMALYPEKWHFSTSMLYLRLPLQALLIYWAIYTARL